MMNENSFWKRLNLFYVVDTVNTGGTGNPISAYVLAYGHTYVHTLNTFSHICFTFRL
jgi:hypothetical protein